MNWNPDANDALGLQWQPSRESSVVLDAVTKMAAESIEQTASVAIGVNRVAVGAIPTRGGVYAVEVYDDETGVPSGAELLTARPNEDVTLNGWTEDDGTATSIFSEIDDTTLNLADFIRSPVGAPAAATAQYVHRYSTAGLSLTGKRMLSVSLGVVVSSVPGSKINNVLNVGLNIGGVVYPIGTVQARSSTFDIGYFTLLYNPSTGAPWTIAEVQAFDSSDEVVFYVNNVPYSRVYVYMAWMDIAAVTENRKAVGVLDDRASGLTPNAWNAATMTTPTGGAWTKDGTGRHLYTVRRSNGVGSLVIPTLEEPGVVPENAAGFSPTVDPSTAIITEMGDEHGALFGLIQRTTAPAEHADSVAYADAIEALVYTGQDAEQEITAVADDYGVVRARIKPNSATGNLLVKIKKRSDNSQAGSTITITPEDAASLPEDAAGWRILVEILATVPTLSAVQYYVEFSSTALGVNDDWWSVLAVDTLDQGNATTYGGTTDRALVNGTEADRYDLAVSISTIPDPVTNFETELASLALDGDGNDCSVDSLVYVHATWTPTSLSGDFGRYEIDRSEDGGTTWVTVAKLATEATSDFDDFESLRGVQACYRIRVVRIDESPSEWSSESCQTPTAADCEWLFTSNRTPSLNAGYNQLGPETEYVFPRADDRKYHRIYGRDGRLAFIGTEDPLVDFELPLIVQADPTEPTAGVAVFGPLRALMGADVPYVCVLDATGNRFYADLVVPSGSANRNARVYLATVGIVELTLTPTPVT